MKLYRSTSAFITLLMITFIKCQDFSVTNQELKDIGNILWQKDHRLANVHLHLQGILQLNQSQSALDVAPDRLFGNGDVLEGSSTVQNFVKLLDNYHPNVRDKENFTDEQKLEITDFLNSVVETDVMKTAWAFLVAKNFSSMDKEEFVNQLKTLWFTLYTKSKRANCCSGFEHVFLGETKGLKTSGFHNWIRFYLEEKAGLADYSGYYFSDRIDKEENLLKLKFKWIDHLKPMSSMFVTTTPEFEMALYTVCHYSRPRRSCKVNLNNKSLTVFTTTKTEKGIDYILTAYPVV